MQVLRRKLPSLSPAKTGRRLSRRLCGPNGPPLPSPAEEDTLQRRPLALEKLVELKLGSRNLRMDMEKQRSTYARRVVYYAFWAALCFLVPVAFGFPFGELNAVIGDTPVHGLQYTCLVASGLLAKDAMNSCFEWWWAEQEAKM